MRTRPPDDGGCVQRYGLSLPARSMHGLTTRGFTLVELVLILVLIGVLTLFALPRFFSLAAYSERGYLDAALSAARFAQRHAVASGCNVRVRFSAAGYSLTRAATCQGSTFGPAVSNPSGGGPFAQAPPSGVTVSAADLYFDAAGRPRNPATGNRLTAVTSVTIGSRILRIEPDSGYVNAP